MHSLQEGGPLHVDVDLATLPLWQNEGRREAVATAIGVEKGRKQRRPIRWHCYGEHLDNRTTNAVDSVFLRA